MVTLSKDGYLRMTVETFRNLPLVHLLSGLDEEGLDSNQSPADACGISGYTEWISSTSPVVTIGWDWRLDVSQGSPRYVLTGFPRSNLMLLDADRRDLGPVRTVILLKAAVDGICWQEETKDAISARYGATTCQV